MMFFLIGRGGLMCFTGRQGCFFFDSLKEWRCNLGLALDSFDEWEADRELSAFTSVQGLSQRSLVEQQSKLWGWRSNLFCNGNRAVHYWTSSSLKVCTKNSWSFLVSSLFEGVIQRKGGLWNHFAAPQLKFMWLKISEFAHRRLYATKEVCNSLTSSPLLGKSSFWGLVGWVLRCNRTSNNNFT